MSTAVDVVHWGGHHGPAPVVCATAAWNGLAASAYQTWAFRRAELTAMSETPFVCTNGERATMVPIRAFPARAMGANRVWRIARALVEQILTALGATLASARVGLVLCLPERMAQGAERAKLERALGELLRAHGVEPVVHGVARGHASLAHAMIEAGSALASRKIDVAIVGGADTYYEPAVVQELLDQKRLFDGENLDSFIPGEGGAFCVLTRADIARWGHWPVLARLECAAAGSEPASMLGDAPCAGLGLSRVLRAAVDRLQDERRTLDWWLADLTNEAYRAHEFQLAYPRAVAGVARAEVRLEFLPALLGDLGAATMPTALAIAAEGFVRGDPDAATCLLSASSVGDARGAVLLAREA